MLLTKHKYLFFTMIILLVLSLVGCKEQNNNSAIVKFDGKTIISATVLRVGENTSDVTYNQENLKELQTFVNAIKRAKKINGVVNVVSPDYLLKLTFEDKSISKYSLWLSDDGGSIMNELDTNYLYVLPKDLIDDLNKIIK